MTTTTIRRPSKKLGISLWTIQILLAALFLFAGGTKLVMPPEQLAGPLGFSESFMRFIGICETLGALGLVLPGLTHIKTVLTPLAAAGLVIIMIGATVSTVLIGAVAGASVPFIVGVLAATVAYTRWRVAPHREGSRRVLAYA